MGAEHSASLKILIVAPNASSRFGGEAFLPLKYFQILRRRGLPATLIAHARNRCDLKETLAPFFADIRFVDDTIWHRIIWRIATPFPLKIREIVFANLLNRLNTVFQARLIRDLMLEGRVDLIHQPTPVSPRAPSAIYGFGIPVIIGPMNGGMHYPSGYENLESPVMRRFIHLARGTAQLMNWLVPGKRKAAVLLVANARTRAALPFSDHPHVVELVENGVDLGTWKTPDRSSRISGTTFGLVFMGRLVDWKAIDITLAALVLARSRGLEVTLDILGDGPERAGLEARASEPDLVGAVRFHGFLPQKDCVPFLDQADALILNSVYECGGAVVLEAMSLGLPVIASDWGGPADYLDPSCGILVSPIPRDTFADRLADAIARLVTDPELCRRMGAAGAAKVLVEYDWEKKVDQILKIYACAAVKTLGSKPPS